MLKLLVGKIKSKGEKLSMCLSNNQDPVLPT